MRLKASSPPPAQLTVASPLIGTGKKFAPVAIIQRRGYQKSLDCKSRRESAREKFHVLYKFIP
jgi:hypothetical protein